jgi:hypothetical protein
MDKPESYETAQYSGPNEVFNTFSTIYQIVEEKGHPSPQFSIKASLQGDQLRLTYRTYEMFAPSRIAEIKNRGEKALHEMVKVLKEEFKSRTQKPLTLKEQKDAANHTFQKINLHERYHYAFWQMFKVG